VFQVVEDQQPAPAAEVVGDGRQGVPGAALGDAERLGDRRHHQRRVTKGGELDDRHGPTELGSGPSGRLHRQARLADATRSGEGEQPRASRGECPDDVPEFAPASDQRRSGVAGRRARRVGNAWPGPTGPGGGGQFGPLRLVEREGVGERTDGMRVRPAPFPALQRADRLGGESGPLGQLLLRQRCRVPEAAQPGRERAHVPALHCAGR
jgi:hypothetical protein